MYRKLLCCLLVVVMVFVSGGARLVLPVEADSVSAEKNVPTDASATKRDFTDSEVLVAMTHEESLKFTKYTAADFAEIGCASVKDLSSAAAEKVQKVLRGEKLAEDSIGAAFMNKNINVDTFHAILSLKLAEPGKDNVLRAVALLNQREDVYIAEPNYIIQMDRMIVPAEPIPGNNPVYGWAAEKIGQEDAWEIETGSTSVLVGVLDTGIDASHPELSGRVDPYLSRDFTGDGYSATQDPVGHGTHVAGIIGAKHNADSLNFSGVCQNVKLVSLRVINASDSCTSGVLINAIDYARTKGISILNISIDDGLGFPPIFFIATNNYPGLIISAAGNGGMDLDDYIDSQPDDWESARIIFVGASTTSDRKKSDSNYGDETVDLFAPGATILSCYSLDTNDGVCEATNCPYLGHIAYGYHNLSGTSMAAPFVTGVAALILAHKPGITKEQIKTVICDSVDYVSALAPYCKEGGRLNALKALSHPLLHSSPSYIWEDTTYHTVQWGDCNKSILEEHNGPSGAHRCTDCGGAMEY